MTHSNLNPVNPDHPKRAAIVIANPAISTSTGWPVGFWWFELTHPYYAFTDVGWDVDVYSPEGGNCAWDAMSDPEDQSEWQKEDVISRGYKHDPEFRALVENTKNIDELNVDEYDVLVVAGGQALMFTFKDATNLHRKFVDFYITGKVTAALCHGTAILAFATLPDGTPLVKDKTVTGFPNVEEDLADQMTWEAGALPEGTHIMPWRVEDELRKSAPTTSRPARSRASRSRREPRHRSAELQRRRNGEGDPRDGWAVTGESGIASRPAC